MPLSVGLCADRERHRAVGIELRVRGFGTLKGAGLDISRHADAADFPIGVRLPQTLVEGLPSGALDGDVHMPLEFAYIVEPAGLRAVGKLFRPDEIAAADFLAPDAQSRAQASTSFSSRKAASGRPAPR